MRNESRPGLSSFLIPRSSPLRIGILLSGRGRGSNMQAIIDACRSGLVPGEVARVVSTSPGTPALERARAAGVDTLIVAPSETAIHHRDTETQRGQQERATAAESTPMKGDPRSPESISSDPSVSLCLCGEFPPET